MSGIGGLIGRCSLCDGPVYEDWAGRCHCLDCGGHRVSETVPDRVIEMTPRRQVELADDVRRVLEG